jgi:hypothetical protein
MNFVHLDWANYTPYRINDGYDGNSLKVKEDWINPITDTPEDGGAMFLRNVGTHIQVHTALNPRKPPSTSSPT